MKNIILGLAACTLSLSSLAQLAPCGTDMQHQRLLADPEYVEYKAQLQAELRQLFNSSRTERDENTVYTIPIVFHIIHLNGEENITNEQILDAVDIVNRDFAALNPDTIGVHPAFADIIGNSKIQFELPTLDPYGACTNGINRYQSPQTFYGELSSKLKPWPRSQYLNIWVTKAIASGAAGYFTAFPSFADGVLILHDYVGSIGTGQVGRSRALTHELGHYLDLNHVWGENNGTPEAAPPGHMVTECGDDGVTDTPFTRGWSFCPAAAMRADCDRQPFRNTIYNFDDVTTSSGATDPSTVIDALDSVPPNIVRATFSPFTATGVSANSAVAGKFAFSNWDTGALDGEVDYDALGGGFGPTLGKYYSVTVTPKVSDLITVSTVNFKAARNASGVRTFVVRSSLNNYSTNAVINMVGDTNIVIKPNNVAFFKHDVSTTNATVTFTVSGAPTNSDTPITLRIYAWNAEDAAGTFVIDEVEVNGNLGRIENVENYMEYSYCSKMFTDGQVERMRTMAESTVSERASLWTESNLQATGIADGYRAACAPYADFYAVVGPTIATLNNPPVPFSATACTGETVRFMDNSTGAFPTDWAWTFQDGSPATSTERNPDVTFNSGGWKTVTLTASNANGSDTKTNQYAVLIGGNDLAPYGIYTESFEGDQINPYFVNNYGNNHTFFQHYTTGGHTGTKCVRLNSGDRNELNFIDPDNAGDYDELISPNFDLSNYLSAQMSFWYSYSTSTTNIDTVTERLEVYSSTNCGASWQIRVNINQEELITNGSQGGPPQAWVQRTINLPGSALSPDVLFRFRFISSAFSNDLFIDDINFSGPVGIEALDQQRLLNVFPNPSNDQFTVQAFGMDAYRTQVTITDMRGAIVYEKNLAPTGSDGINISSQEHGMSNGLYILRVSNELGTSTQKLTVGR